MLRRGFAYLAAAARCRDPVRAIPLNADLQEGNDPRKLIEMLFRFFVYLKYQGKGVPHAQGSIGMAVHHRRSGGTPHPPLDPPPLTPAQSDFRGKNEIYHRENLVGPFWHTNFWVPDPPPPPPLLILPCPGPDPVPRAPCSTSPERPTVSHTTGTTQGMAVFMLFCVLAGIQVLISIGSMIHRLYSTCSSYATLVAISENCTYPLVNGLVEHTNQEGDTCNYARTFGLMAESVYGGDIQSIDTDH